MRPNKTVARPPGTQPVGDDSFLAIIGPSSCIVRMSDITIVEMIESEVCLRMATGSCVRMHNSNAAHRAGLFNAILVAIKERGHEVKVQAKAGWSFTVGEW